MKIPPAAAALGPICNACHKPCWRNRRATSQFIGTTEPYGGEVTVCVWCSAVWKIVDGKCVPLNEAEMKECAPELEPVLKIFDNNRKCAKRLGVTLDDFLMLCDLVP